MLPIKRWVGGVPHSPRFAQFTHFLLSLGYHLARPGDSVFRSWYHCWSSRIQSKFFLIRPLITIELTTVFDFIRKMPNSRQAMHPISFLFQDPKMLRFLCYQAV